MTRTSTGCRTISNSHRLSAFALLLLPSIALAHPGHGSGFLPGFLHPFHGLDHLLAAVAVGLWSARLGGRAAWALPAAFVAAMLVGGVVAHTGLAVPAMEFVIALSVLVLGAVAATNARLAMPASMAVVAVFALFHGGAHGTESPAQAGFVTYAAGLALATAALHASGIATALVLKARPGILRVVAAPIALAGAWMLIARMA